MKKNMLGKRMAKYKKRGFSKSQLKEIRRELKNGLSIKQVDCYAKLKNSPSYMRTVRKGLEHGLEEQYIKVPTVNVHEPYASQYDEEVLYDMAGLDGMDEWDDDLDDIED